MITFNREQKQQGTTFKSVPLSDNEINLYNMIQQDKLNSSYNLIKSFYYKGQLDKKILQLAYDQLFVTNENIRAAYIKNNKNNELKKIIYNKITAPLTFIECKSLSDFNNTTNQYEKVNFNVSLNMPPVIKFFIIQFQDRTNILVNMSHLVLDGWGGGILFKEFSINYNILYTVDKLTRWVFYIIPSKKYNFYKFILKIINKLFFYNQMNLENIVKNKIKLKKTSLNKIKKNILKEEYHTPSFTFPVQQNNMLVANSKTTNNSFVFSKATMFELHKFCDGHNNVSLGKVLLAAYNITLYLLSNINKIRIRVPATNRRDKNTKYLTYYLTHEFLFCIEIKKAYNFLQVLEKSNKNILHCKKYRQDQVSIAKLLSENNLLPNVEFNYYSLDLEVPFNGLTINSVDGNVTADTQSTWHGDTYKIDLSLFLNYRKKSDNILGEVITRDKHFDPRFAKQFTDIFMEVLHNCIACPTGFVSLLHTLPLISHFRRTCTLQVDLKHRPKLNKGNPPEN